MNSSTNPATIEVIDQDSRQFVMIYGDVIRRMPEITSSGFSVYACLKFIAGRKENCFPSHRYLATLSGLSEKTVRTAIDRLVEAGLIERTSRVREDGSATSNSYVIVALTTPSVKITDPPSVKITDLELDSAMNQITPSELNHDDFSENDSALTPFDVYRWWREDKLGLPMPAGRPPGIDMRNAKLLLSVIGGIDELEAAWTWFRNDRYWSTRPTTLGVMYAQWSNFTAASSPGMRTGTGTSDVRSVEEKPYDQLTREEKEALSGPERWRRSGGRI